MRCWHVYEAGPCGGRGLVGAAMDGQRVRGAIVESRSGRELFEARAFLDSTAYGHLAAYSGARYTEPNDYEVANSVGVSTPLRGWGIFLSVSVAVIVLLPVLWVVCPAAACQPRRTFLGRDAIRLELAAEPVSGDSCPQG